MRSRRFRLACGLLLPCERRPARVALLLRVLRVAALEKNGSTHYYVLEPEGALGVAVRVSSAHPSRL